MDQPTTGTAAAEPHALVVGAEPGPLALVVNDDEAILVLIADLLGGEGYRVSTRLMAFESPAEVAALAPDVLVADLRLGGTLEEGLGFLERLHADPLTTTLPVVVCSAARPEVLAEAAARLGDQPHALVGKPFDVDEFLAAVAGCVRRA